MQIIVEKLLTQYTRMGKGDTILLLHGWGDSSKGTVDFAKKLDDRFEVICIDLPGFGGSQAPESSWGLDNYADFVCSFISKLNLNLSVVIGHSNGGAIAIRSLSRGLKANHLILVASAGIRGEFKGRNKVLRIIAKTGKALAKPLPGSIQKKLRRKLYTSVGSDMLVAEHLQETFKRVIVDDVSAEAQNIKIPTLIIYGDNDVSTPSRYGELFKNKISNSKLVIIPGGEHMLLTENTDQVATMVKEFLV